MLNRCILTIPVLALFFLMGTIAKIANAEDPLVVGYSGVFLSGGKNSEANYPIFARNKVKLGQTLKGVMERLNNNNALPFNLIFETDAESRKHETDNPYSLAIVITRDDITSEKYEATGVVVYKTFINVGMVVIIYHTSTDLKGNQKNTILFSIPLVGFMKNMEGNRLLADEEINSFFISTASKTLEDHLGKKLARLSLEQIKGVVTNIDKEGVLISIGAIDGLVEGQNIIFMKENEKKGSGKITKLFRKTALVKQDKPELILGPDMQVRGINMKGFSEETYQVIDCKVSSKKMAQLFPANKIGPSIAQWFSDFFVDRAGKIVLPSRIGGEWDSSATESSFMVLLKDGQEYRFEMAPPKYPVTLDLTGLAIKKMSGNDINEVWLYKVWMKVDVNKKGFSKEFESVATKNVVPSIQSYQSRDEIYELLYQVTAKAASEENL